jgi:hypothetical protein
VLHVLFLLLEWRDAVGEVYEVDHEANGFGIVTGEVGIGSVLWRAFEDDLPFVRILNDRSQNGIFL